MKKMQTKGNERRRQEQIVFRNERYSNRKMERHAVNVNALVTGVENVLTTRFRYRMQRKNVIRIVQ